MIIIDKPYISEHVIQTITKNRYPVLRNQISESLLNIGQTKLIDEAEAVRLFKQQPEKRIYTASENSIEWVINNLGFTGLPEKIDLFKNKMKFRKMTEELFPGLFYKEININDLSKVRVEKLPMPLILKPTVGFFSIGVKTITSPYEWNKVIETVRRELKHPGNIYPEEVLDINNFILEGYIPGDEFAIDAYFNNEGEPVILGIMKHVFSSNEDVGDRLYTTSKEIILENLDKFRSFLEDIGKLADLKNFPLHVEVRKNIAGGLVPIEVNPLRFGAWCTTADATWYFFEMNPYEYYFRDRTPDWRRILENKDGKIFSMIVLDNTTGQKAENINEFNYKELLQNFGKIIEFRKIDHKKFNVFGFIFIETDESNRSELEWILNSDLKEFIS